MKLLSEVQGADPPQPPRLVTAIAALLVLAALLWRTPPGNSYGGYAFAGAAVVCLSRSTHREILAAALAFPLFTLLFRGIHPGPAGPWLWSAAVGAGAASLGVSAVGTIKAPNRDEALRKLAAGLAMPAFVLVAAIVLQAASGRQALTYDAILAGMDRALGIDASTLAVRALVRSPLLYSICNVVYDSLPLALCVAAAARWRKLGSDDPAPVLLQMIVAAGVGLIVFWIIPACGPRFLWAARFPMAWTTQVPVRVISVAPGEFRNALPSLHMTGALFVAWALRPFGAPIRVLAWAYVIVTALATLGSGQHYLVDLVVAVPFALAIDLVLRGQQRARAAATAGLVFSWIALVRWAPAYPAAVPFLTVALSVLSVAGPFVEMGRFSRRGETALTLNAAS
jgi:PAP2 superfamily